jgi:hypothetical protein
MGEVIEIYGSKIRLPDRPANEDGVNYGLPRKEQKWVKKELPAFFEKVEYSKDGKLILTTEQEKYADTELERCREGVWVWIGEKMRYITGRYYFYLQYYILEDGNAPDFREADRLYYLFFNYWFHVMWCLGIIRIKKRRQGASSQSCSNILYEAIFYKNSNCGLISKTREDSKATFTEMITNAYQLLPPFFKQRLIGKEESVTELVLAHDKGANSKINYRAPVLNAYDRGRMSYVLGDEFGKLPPDVPASTLLGIISKTLVKGIKRVGWIDLPSTVNELTKGGGAEYKKIFDSANQFKRKQTINRVVRFFQPAYEAYEGFIDEYGDSVVDTPTQEQYDYLVAKWVRYNEDGDLISEISEDDVKLGAKVYVMHKRRDGLEGDDLEEEARMNPCDEDEAFMYMGTGCEFNAGNIKKQQNYLEENPVYLRQIRLDKKEEMVKSDVLGAKEKKKVSVSFMDDPKGGWLLLEKPIKDNNFKYDGKHFEPLGKHLYQIGVDTTKDDFALHGSKPTICVFKKSLIIEGVETGNYPVAIYVDKTRLDVHFDDEVLKASLWYGCTTNYEIDSRTDFYKYFWKQGASSMLEWTPKFAQDPVKFTPAKYKPGTQSADPYQLAAQLQAAKMYIDGTNPDEYNGNVHRIMFPIILSQLLKYDHSDRTKFDQVIALIMALLPVLGEAEIPRKDNNKPKEVLKTFKIKMAS